MTREPPEGKSPELARMADALRRAALDSYQDWDQRWAVQEKAITARGDAIHCKPGCVSCCFSRKHCSLSEGFAIIDFVAKTFAPDQQERFRLRAESAASSLRKLRADGYCDSEDGFFLAGGAECPFLEKGACSIYPVRPLDCRGLNVIAGNTSPERCRQCPQVANCMESEQEYRQVKTELETEQTRIFPSNPKGHQPPNLLPEILSYLWEEAPPTKFYHSNEAMRLRLATRGTERDEIWRDDGSDFRALRMPVSLPEEGDYAADLTLLRQGLENHELYGQIVQGANLPDFCSLYKRNGKCKFDWKKRKFTNWKQNGEDMPFTVWMSDGLQERLMMWEAAKRSRGRVLCGGLGLGIYPQMALSLPRVESIDIIECDPDVIALIETAWKKNPWPGMGKVNIRLSPVESYLEKTKERYDTVYIDTWDAIYNEYLPHLNELTRLAKPVLRTGGEILLWAFDLMVQAMLETAQLVLDRRKKYLAIGTKQLENIEHLYPQMHRLVEWLREHPKATDDAVRTAAYRLATMECHNLGVLALSGQPGAQDLLDKKYSKGSLFLQ